MKKWIKSQNTAEDTQKSAETATPAPLTVDEWKKQQAAENGNTKSGELHKSVAAEAVAEPEEREVEAPPVSKEDAAKVEKFSQAIAKIRSELAKDIVGMEDVVDNVICAIIAGGNVLLEGVPGVGK
ncbi:MAG: hypothetical protein J1G05_03115, partial [Clostridiales bacterium]|nr:hypothetical protein [Clostridiales bacterium]